MHQNNIKAKKIWKEMKSLIFNIVGARNKEVYVTELMFAFFVSVALEHRKTH